MTKIVIIGDVGGCLDQLRTVEPVLDDPDAVLIQVGDLQTAEPVPFGQIHGHSTIVDFRRRTWLCPERIRLRSTVDWAARHTVTRIGATEFIGVDPKHGRDGAPNWAPLILTDATLLA